MKYKGELIYKKALKLALAENPDMEEVYNLLCQSYEKGNPNAAYAIGTWYLFGTFVKKNFKKGATYLEFAADCNVADACYDLAVCYEKGKGKEKNLPAAFEYYLKASMLGSNTSIYEVGRCLYHGIGVKADKAQAEIWFEIDEIKKGTI